MKPPLVSVAFLVIGLVVFGLGEALLVTAGVGVSPWTVFAEGVTNMTGWSLGFASFIISACVLVLWIPLKRTPGIGTILNAIIISLVLEYVLDLSRICAAPSARLSHLSFESDRTFPAQC